MNISKLYKKLLFASRQGDSIAVNAFALEIKQKTGTPRFMSFDPASGPDYSVSFDLYGYLKKLIEIPPTFKDSLYTQDWAPSPMDDETDEDFKKRLKTRLEYLKRLMEIPPTFKNSVLTGRWDLNRYRKPVHLKGGRHTAKAVDVLNQSTGGFFGPSEVIDEIKKGMEDEQVKKELVRVWKGPQKPFTKSKNKERRSSTTDFPYSPEYPAYTAPVHKCPKGSLPCPVCSPRKVKHAF